MKAQTRVRVAAVLVISIAGSANAADQRSAILNGCPIVVCVSSCPSSEQTFCASYGCITNVTSCTGEFGSCGSHVLYCGTPMPD